MPQENKIIPNQSACFKQDEKSLPEIALHFCNFLQTAQISQKDNLVWKEALIEIAQKLKTNETLQINWGFKGENELYLEFTEKRASTEGSSFLKLLQKNYEKNDFFNTVEYWTNETYNKLLISKIYPYKKNADNTVEANALLEGALEELSFCYESLNTFYKLSTAFIEVLSVEKFIEEALEKMGQIIAYKSLWVDFSHRILQPLLSELKSFKHYRASNQEILQNEEFVWENAFEVKGNQELEAFPCGIKTPIVANDELWGTMVVTWEKEKVFHKARDLNTIRTFCDLIGIAIAYANNKLLQEEAQKAVHDLEIASHIQEKLLPVPTLPKSDKWMLYGERKSARKVSGDYIDAVVNKTGDIFLIIADVMGKGVPAALLASMLRSAFHMSVDREAFLIDIIYALNRNLSSHINNLCTFATCSIVKIDHRLSTLEIVNAGHCPSLLYSKNKLYKEVHPSGPPIGAFEDSVYKVEYYPLSECDTLILVTDGLFEWFLDDKIWGWEQFKNYVQGHLENPHNLWHNLQNLIQKGKKNFFLEDDQTFLYWKLKN